MTLPEEEFLSPESQKKYEKYLQTKDVKELENFLAVSKYSDIIKNDLNFLTNRLHTLQHLQQLEEQKNDPAIKSSTFDPPRLLSSGKKHQLKIKLNTKQSIENGSWSVSLSNLLKCHGIELSQQEIRANNYNQNEESNVFSSSDLVMKALPNTGVRNITYDSINDTNKTAILDDFKTVVSDIIQNKHEPVSILVNGHYQTITGIDLSKKDTKLFVSNPSKESGKDGWVKLTDLLKHDHVEITWLEQLKIERDGKVVGLPNSFGNISYAHGKIVSDNTYEKKEGIRHEQYIPPSELVIPQTIKNIQKASKSNPLNENNLNEDVEPASTVIAKRTKLQDVLNGLNYEQISLPSEAIGSNIEKEKYNKLASTMLNICYSTALKELNLTEKCDNLVDMVLIDKLSDAELKTKVPNSYKNYVDILAKAIKIDHDNTYNIQNYILNNFEKIETLPVTPEEIKDIASSNIPKTSDEYKEQNKVLRKKASDFLKIGALCDNMTYHTPGPKWAKVLKQKEAITLQEINNIDRLAYGQHKNTTLLAKKYLDELSAIPSDYINKFNLNGMHENLQTMEYYGMLAVNSDALFAEEGSKLENYYSKEQLDNLKTLCNKIKTDYQITSFEAELYNNPVSEHIDFKSLSKEQSLKLCVDCMLNIGHSQTNLQKFATSLLGYNQALDAKKEITKEYNPDIKNDKSSAQKSIQRFDELANKQTDYVKATISEMNEMLQKFDERLLKAKYSGKSPKINDLHKTMISLCTASNNSPSSIKDHLDKINEAAILLLDDKKFSNFAKKIARYTKNHSMQITENLNKHTAYYESIIGTEGLKSTPNKIYKASISGKSKFVNSEALDKDITKLKSALMVSRLNRNNTQKFFNTLSTYLAKEESKKILDKHVALMRRINPNLPLNEQNLIRANTIEERKHSIANSDAMTLMKNSWNFQSTSIEKIKDCYMSCIKHQKDIESIKDMSLEELEKNLRNFKNGKGAFIHKSGVKSFDKELEYNKAEIIQHKLENKIAERSLNFNDNVIKASHAAPFTPTTVHDVALSEFLKCANKPMDANGLKQALFFEKVYSTYTVGQMSKELAGKVKLANIPKTFRPIIKPSPKITRLVNGLLSNKNDLAMVAPYIIDGSIGELIKLEITKDGNAVVKSMPSVADCKKWVAQKKLGSIKKANAVIDSMKASQKIYKGTYAGKAVTKGLEAMINLKNTVATNEVPITAANQNMVTDSLTDILKASYIKNCFKNKMNYTEAMNKFEDLLSTEAIKKALLEPQKTVKSFLSQDGPDSLLKTAERELATPQITSPITNFNSMPRL